MLYPHIIIHVGLLCMFMSYKLKKKIQLACSNFFNAFTSTKNKPNQQSRHKIPDKKNLAHNCESILSWEVNKEREIGSLILRLAQNEIRNKESELSRYIILITDHSDQLSNVFLESNNLYNRIQLHSFYYMDTRQSFHYIK